MRPWPGAPEPANQAVPDLVARDFTADAPNTKYVGDITYLPCGAWKFLYLATVIDCYSRRLVGWSIADHMRTDLVAGALRAAARERGSLAGAIFHADHGAQPGLNRSSQHLDRGGVDGTSAGMAGPDSHLQRVQREVGAQRGGQLPADHPPREHVDDERGVDPSGERAAVGDVSDPQLVRAAGGEVAVHEIRARVRPGPRDRGARALGSGDPPQAGRAHEAVDSAARDPVALAVQLGVNLADPVDPVVRRMDVPDHRRGRRVGDRPRRGRPGQVGVVAARGDLQVPADRLDPELGLVHVDERDDHLDGRSSSAAKKADALRKIALDRRSSLTSRSSSANRAASDAVVPARSPASTSAWLTHPRNVSGLIPSCSPTRCNAPGRLTGSRRASTAIRTARSRSSSGYFLGATMTLILSGIESLHQTRHETRPAREVVAGAQRALRTGDNFAG